MAIAILSTALVATLATYASEIRTLTRAREVAVAVELAQDRLAAVELFAMEQLPNVPDSLAEGTFSGPFDAYAWQTEARSIPGRELAEVRVRIDWDGGAHEVTTVLPLTGLRRIGP